MDERTLLSSASASASASGSTPDSPELQLRQPHPLLHIASAYESASSSFSEHSPCSIGVRRISNTQQHLYQKAAVGVFTGTRLRQLRRRRQCSSPSHSGSADVFSGPTNSPPLSLERRSGALAVTVVSVSLPAHEHTFSSTSTSPIPSPHRPKSLSISVPRPHFDERDLDAAIAVDPHHLKAPNAALSVASPEHLLNLSPRFARLKFGHSRNRPPLERSAAFAVSPAPSNNKFSFSFFKSASNR